MFTRGEIVAKQSIKHNFRLGGIGGGNRNETARFGVHSGHPHHFGFVFTKTLGALQSITLLTDFFEDVCFFKLVVSEIFFILGGDFKQGGFCNKHLVFRKKCGEQAVEEREQKRTNLEAVLVGIGTNNNL